MFICWSCSFELRHTLRELWLSLDQVVFYTVTLDSKAMNERVSAEDRYTVRRAPNREWSSLPG